MDHIFPVTAEDACKKCGRKVFVVVRSDELSFNSPSIRSDCKATDCPVNESYKPNDIQMVDVSFSDERDEL